MKLEVCLVAAALGGACAAATAATEYATVLSSTPVTAQVGVPQQVCRDEPQALRPATGGGGALLGAVIGGIVGSAVGGGSGQAVAAGVGAVTGAMVGDRTEAANTPPAFATVRNCHTAVGYENRLFGYDVVYEYNGQRHTARVSQDPGSRIALNVTVSPAAGEIAAAPATYLAMPPVVYASPPSYGYYGPGYYSPAYYGWGPAIAFTPRFFFGAHWHHGGGHGRHR